jgi:ribosomal protein S26
MKTKTSDLKFRKSSSSGVTRTLCVEVAIHSDIVAVRDSKQPKGRILRFSPEEWQAFVAGVKAGEFEC